MSYQKYGISEQLVAKVKSKLKNEATKQRMKALLNGVTKYDLQDRAKVRRFVGKAATIVNEQLSTQQTDNIVSFVIASKIDPNNTLHLIRLWSMFR